MSATANISTDGARYEYRADGMRVLKVEGLSLVWVEEAENEEEEQEEGSGYWDEFWSANKPTSRATGSGRVGSTSSRRTRTTPRLLGRIRCMMDTGT